MSFGCDQCFGADAEIAWAASRTRRVRQLIEESHFSLQVTACSCGQHFVVVFTERIDWQGGEDDQTWLVLPVTREESEQLLEASVQRQVTSFSAGRRFLVRSFPTGGSLSTWWRESGFAIGPHD